MALRMVRGVPPSPSLKSPREVKPIEEEVVDNKEKITTGDTVHFSENHKMKKIDKEDATIDDSIKFSAKQLEKAKAELKTELKKDANQQRIDNEEIHKGKVAAAWWGSIPLAGPVISLLSNALVNPEQKAENRADVRAKYRTKEEGVEQEQKIKEAKLNATLVTALPQVMILPFVLSDKTCRELLSNPKQAMYSARVILSLAPLVILVPISLLAFLLALPALGYTFFEKPYSEDSNKRL